MNRNVLRIAIICAILIAWMPMHAADALHTMDVVTVRASYAHPDHGLNNLNDGNSNTNAPYWSSLRDDAEGEQLDYVEYSWPVACDIVQYSVYWKVDDEKLLLPTEAYIMTWNGHEWERAGDVPEARANASTARRLTLHTNRLRLYMRSAAACGIREFVVMGTLDETCASPTLTTKTTRVFIDQGETATLQPELQLPADAAGEEPNWYWLNERGDIVATTATMEVASSGIYTVCYERPCGACATLRYVVSINGEFNPLIGYQWPAYTPTLDYDFRQEYPSLPAPTKGRLPEDVNVAMQVDGEWWSAAVGPNANPLITEESMRLLVKKMDEDFAYFRDEMGWPPDKRARNGYYSQVYGYGSGLSFDASTPNTATGGWQSATYFNGSSWPMVFLSYYPIYSFDPQCTYGDRIGQQNACVHEGIHATFADLEGCKNAAWFHEGGNTWLQGEAEVRKSGRAPESMGFLSAGNMIAPFMPIECYSGWLQDDSFGGPAAEGVNMYNGSQQICTWRNQLGGVQYGELFPHFCSEILGKGSIPWIWRHCKSRVLEGMAKGETGAPGLGDEQIRRLILEYRSRQAMLDVGLWSQACEALLDGNWLLDVHAEWEPSWIQCDKWRATPYAKMTAIENADSTGWWKPEWRTTPGWSGANQVVLHTSGRAGDDINISVKAIGAKNRNLVCQLCYRTSAGTIYYGQPVQCRANREVEVGMHMPEAPANGVVIAVICNTDYIYEGDQTRKAHYNYHVKMGKNVWQPATSTLKWYKYREEIRDKNFNYTGISEMAAQADAASAEFRIVPAKTVAEAGQVLHISFEAADQWQVPVQLYAADGRVVYQQSFLRDGDLQLPASLRPGMYVLRATSSGRQSSARIIIK